MSKLIDMFVASTPHTAKKLQLIIGMRSSRPGFEVDAGANCTC
jgi:hypothetical protein